MSNNIEEQAEQRESPGFNEGDFHGLLFAYGEVCEAEGVLSPKAVGIRLDIATHYNDLTSRLAKQKENWEKEKAEAISESKYGLMSDEGLQRLMNDLEFEEERRISHLSSKEQKGSDSV